MNAIHPNDIPKYIIDLEGVDLSAREYAAFALGSLRAHEGINALCGVVSYAADATLRRKAAWALGEIALSINPVPERVTESLTLALLSTTQLDVLHHCGYALKKVGVQAIPYLQTRYNKSKVPTHRSNLRKVIEAIDPVYASLVEGL